MKKQKKETEIERAVTHVLADEWRADTDNAEQIPRMFTAKVNDLLSEVSRTLICAMKRRGLAIECIEFQWLPDGEDGPAYHKLRQVTRLRSVLELDHSKDSK